MKDYNLVRHIAKLAGAKPKRDKNALVCYFFFGDDVIPALVTFKNKTSTNVLFDLSYVYKTHGKKYGVYENFIAAFTEKYKFFETAQLDGKAYVVSDLSRNRIAHVASQALTSVTAIINCLNDMFGTKYENFTEEEWRDFHRDYLAKQSRNNGIFGWAGVAAWILFVVVFCVALKPDYIVLSILSVPCALASFISFIVFFVKQRYFTKELKKSIEAKKR